MAAAGPFGCEQCAQADALVMAASRSRLLTVARLVDESHFGVSILACPACGQHFVGVFTEWIDWLDGDDPQYFSMLPITAEESQALLTQPEDVTARIEAMGRDRRYLQDDHPKGGPRRVRWVDGGLFIGPHD